MTSKLLGLWTGLVFCCAGWTALGATGVEISPIEIRSGGVVGEEQAKYSERTLVVGIEVDRHGARVLSYTIKDRPLVRSVERESVRPYARNGLLQLEVAVLGNDGRRFTERKTLGPLCLEHEPDHPPHVSGDTLQPHRDSFVIEIPELEGFDRIETAYYESYRGNTGRRSLGVAHLDQSHYSMAGGKIPYGDLAIAVAPGREPLDLPSPLASPAPIGDPPPAPGSEAATVLWPEHFGDETVYRVEGNPSEYDRRVNLVIVPDGYTYAEKALMEQHADELIARMRQTTPYAEHDPLINYTLVYAYSVESGTDQCDCGIALNTAMGTRFPEGNGQCGHGANRCLSYGADCGPSGTRNIIEAELRAPYHDETVIMVNTDRYGGCAGSRATYSAGHYNGPDAGAHEIGHSALGLADEYEVNQGCGWNAGEVNTSTNAAEGAWPEWIEDLGPPHEGAQYWEECVYRPEPGCKMRSLSQPFCAVCRQRGALVFFGHPRVRNTAPIELTSAAPEQVVVDTPVPFDVTTRFGQGAVTNEITWSVKAPGDAEPSVVATDVDTYTHVFDQLGRHGVSCRVTADTNFIKPERTDGNDDLAHWEIEVVGTICEVACGNGVPECDIDGDGLGDACDPCPDQTLNECFGRVAVDRQAWREIRVNTDAGSPDTCGGDKRDCRGALWQSDFGAPEFASGYNQNGDPITCDLEAGCPVDATGIFGCSDDATADLFRCGHEDPEGPPNLTYAFDVPDGDYLLNLLLMNGSAATQDPGTRVFSVAINGEVPVHLSQFDQVAAAGGPCVPTDAPCEPVIRSVPITAAGGSGVAIEFLDEIARPSVKGIELLCKTSAWHTDADGDGFGDPDETVTLCYPPAGYVLDGTDCDDGAPDVHPGAAEVCDAVDNNCDQAIDEDVDGDGFAVCEDCDESAACRWSIPTEPGDLIFQGKHRLRWDDPIDPGGQFARHRGLRSETAADFTTAACLPTSPNLNLLSDPTTPEPGAVLYYLVGGVSSCGPSPLGHAHPGIEREGPACLQIETEDCTEPLDH